MGSNLIRLSLISMISLIAVACLNSTPKKSSSIITNVKIDSCSYKESDAVDAEMITGCANCHTYNEHRTFPEVPTYKEISALDSLKLSDFIFKTRHNGYFIKETKLNRNNKAIDSLNECQRKNLVHFIKDYNRKIPTP